MGNLVGRVMQVGERRVKVGAVIGEGGFSFIHIAHEADTGKPFVLKRSVCQDSDSLLQATTEMDLMRKLPKHPNIVNFYGATHMRNANEVIEVFLLLEFCEAGAISDFVRKRGALSFVDVLHVFEDACYAVGHLHAQSPPILHRDIKLENILVAHGGQYKLCDFGSCTRGDVRCHSAKEIREELERVQVTTTMQYRAPEMLDLHRYREITTKCDVWALGCVLFQLAFGEHPFGQGDLQIINAVYKIPDSSPHPHALDHLIILALQPDPVQRPSALKLHRLSRAISHPGPQASLRVHVPGEERMAKEEEEPEPPKLRQPPPHVHPAIVPDNDSDSDSVVVSTTSNEEDQDEERVADKRVVVGERTAPRSQVAMQLPLGGEEGAVGGDGAALARLHALVDYVAAFLDHQPPNVGARFHATLPPELQALFARARAESDEKDLSAALARELEGEGIGLLTARQSVDDGEEESESYWNPGELEAMGHGHERAVPAIAGGDEKGVRNEGKDSTKGDDGNEEDEGEGDGEGEGEGERCEEKRQEEGEELPRQEAAKEAGEVELAEQARAQAKEEQDERKGKGEQGHDPLLHEQGPGEDAPQQGDGAAKEQALSCGDKAHSVGSCTDKARGKKAKRVTFAEKREEIPGPKSDTKHLDILESDPSDMEMSPVHAPLAEDPSQAAVRKTLVLDARVEWDGDEGDSSSSSSYESFPESEEEGKEGKGEDLEEDQEGGEDKEEEEEEEGSEEDERGANPQGHQAVGRAGSGGGEDGDDERDEPEQESEVRGTASGVEVPARAPEDQPPPPPQPQEQQQSQPQQSPPKQQQSPPRQGGESAKAEGERQGGSEGSRGRDEAANSTPGEVGSTARGQRNGDALGKNANGTAAQQHQHASPAAVAERKGEPAQGNGSGTKPDSPARSSSLPVLRKPPEHPRRRASRPSDWVVFKSAHQGT